MKSTRVADLFYRWDINPFYVVAPLVFLIPISSFVFFYLVSRSSTLYSLIFTVILFFMCSLVFYLYFHRNPKRDTIHDDHVLLSPADGMIVYVKEIKQGVIIESVKKRII